MASLDDSATVNVTHTPRRDDTLVGWLADSRRLAVVRDERELWIVICAAAAAASSPPQATSTADGA